MNSLEKRVWAAVFAKNWDEQPGRLKAASMSGFGPGTDWDAIRETSVDVGIMNADMAVLDLRKRIEKRGSMHHCEDLELERQAEEDIVGSATEDVIVEIGADVPGGDSLRCIKACEAVMARFPGLTAYVGAPPGTKVSGVMVKAEVAARFEGIERELEQTICRFRGGNS